MKTVSDDLFQLIKALTKQEKRYFKLHASRHVIGKENKYVKLFDAIDQQKEYNEERIKKKFNHAPITRQLHVAKNYLYHLLLDSLRSYHESKSEDKFFTLLRNAQLLFNKGLYCKADSSKTFVKVLDAPNKIFSLVGYEDELWLGHEQGCIPLKIQGENIFNSVCVF